MGQQQSNIKDEIKNKYTIIKTISPGEYLVKSLQKGDELQLRIINFPIEDQLIHYIHLLQKRKKIKNPHLLKLIEYNKVIDQLMCSSTFKLKIVSQFPFKTIKDDILERSTSIPKKYFAEDQLWSILYSCCHALYSLYLNKFSHESLTTEQIYIDIDGIIKVADSLLVNGTKNYLSMMGDNLKAQDIRYISPQLRNLVDDNNFYKYQKEKSDVFILGMIILQIANLAPLQYYDLQTKRFYFDVTVSAFQSFKQRYSPKLYEIVVKMLTTDYNIRPTFEEIIQNIEQKTFHTNSNTSSKQSTILDDVKQFSSKQSTLLNKPPDLFSVKQKLNFDKIPVNSVTTNAPLFHQINPPSFKFQTTSSKLNPPQNIIFNKVVEYKPVQPPKIQNYRPIINQQFKQVNNWKFDTISKANNKRQQDFNYTPYQELMNLSGNATLSKNNFNNNLVKKQQFIIYNHLNPNSIHFNQINPPTKMESIPKNSLKQRRFSELKFGGIQINTTQSARVTQKKPITLLPNFTQVKATNLFKQQKKQQQKIIQTGSFIIQENMLGIYQGFTSNNQRNGIGRMIYRDGGSYEGQWKNGKMDGYGKLFYPNGKTAYQGHWLEDQFNGTGRVYNQIQGQQFSNIFIDYADLSDIEDKWVYFQGQFKKDARFGKGIVKFITGQKFYGNFNDDIIEGEGTFYQRSGKVIQGKWSQNILINSSQGANN